LAGRDSPWGRWGKLGAGSWGINLTDNPGGVFSLKRGAQEKKPAQIFENVSGKREGTFQKETGEDTGESFVGPWETVLGNPRET